jgi:hypothetical protein
LGIRALKLKCTIKVLMKRKRIDSMNILRSNDPESGAPPPDIR